MRLTSVVALVLPLIQYTAAQNSSASATPTCLQPRQSPSPVSTDISVVLESAISSACDTSQQKQGTGPSPSDPNTYYQLGSVFFNISTPISPVTQPRFARRQAQTTTCSDAFNLIVNSCINAPNPIGYGYWEGWVVSSELNYSISDYIYPQNPLPNAELSSSSSTVSLSQTSTSLTAGAPPSSGSTSTSASLDPGVSPSSSVSTSNTLQTSSSTSTTAGGSPIAGQISSSSALNAGTQTSTNSPSSALPPSSSTSTAAGGSSNVGQISSTSALNAGTDTSTISSSSTSSTDTNLPLPSLATIITGTVGSQVVSETFVPHIFPAYTTLISEITTTTTLSSGGSPVTVAIGPSGVGWAPYREPSGAPELAPPTGIPPADVASLDSNPTTLVPQKSSNPQGSNSSTSSTSMSITSGSSLTSTQQSGTSASATRTSSTSNSLYIAPIAYVTTAFNNPAQTLTTLSVSGNPAIIYTKETFPGLSNIKAPTTIQTSVIETVEGKISTFIGGIVVGPGGVYWGPPGLPTIPPFPGISPPCIWPFCTGGGGGGGSDPPGDPDPPPPYTPDDPNTPKNDGPTNEPSNQSNNPTSTQGTSTQTSPSSTSSVSSSSSSSTKSSSSSETSSSSSSSSSCSAKVVTDYWVSCSQGSGSYSACSTYSSAKVTSCSASAFTSTTVSACPLGASYAAEPTIAGFDYSNGEYPLLDNPDFEAPASIVWTYTVAEIVSTGVIIGTGSNPSASSGNTDSTTASATTSSGSSTAQASPGATTSSSSGISGSTTRTVLGAITSSSVSSTSSSAAPQDPICVNFSDPDQSIAGYCQCSTTTTSGGSTVTLFTSLSHMTGPNQCGYTSFPKPTSSPTPTSSKSAAAYPYTYTDIVSGPIIACKSTTLEDVAGYQLTECAGDRTTVGTDSAIYSSYVKAESTEATAQAAPSQTATGNCAFWDEALYWTFEVYNINGWAGDNGDSLQNQENGCGDLTSWSWNTGDKDNDQHAYFNLPFFIKSGCVERAIASAGGPSGLSCTAEGLGKRRSLKSSPDSESALKKRRFRTDVSPRKTDRELQALQEAKRDQLAALALPPTTPTRKRLSARSEFEKLGLIESRDLEKRGCLDWLWPFKPSIPEQWWCNCAIPGVDECNAAIQKYSVVGRFPSVFYTSWGGIGDGSLGVEGTKLWRQANICGRSVDFDGIVAQAWMMTTELAIEKPFGKQGLKKTSAELSQIVDPFLKNLSQAFAEQTAGEVYVIIPKGIGFSATSAWTGWEYPALTANPKVTNIWKVELDTSDQSLFAPGQAPIPFTKTLLWSQGQPNPNGPAKGTRGPQLPAQVPSDQIPASWQESL